jgi:uncharacterized protein involved in exopolysaccharide biosynthesis
MSEQLNQHIMEPQQEEEMEIDLMAMARKLWVNRKFLYKAMGIGLVLGVVVALAMPKKYTVQVTLSPELGKSSTGQLANITSMLGLNSTGSGDADALNITLYPDIIASTPFVLELFDAKVTTLDDDEPVTMTDYLDNQKGSIVGTILSLPGKAVGAVMSLFAEKEVAPDTLNAFRLTKEQYQKAEVLRKAMTADVDKKTGVATISVTLGDPVVTATLTDSVVSKLQEYVTRYRVAKAEKDCAYYEKLYSERQQEYYEKQSLYAKYVDANKGVILHSALTERERLQNDMNLAYQVYSQVANQLQVARAKVQEAKPAFAVVEPATVPLLPSGTSRKVLVLAVVFLALVGASAWVLFGRDLLDKLKTALNEEDPADAQAEPTAK